MKTTNYLAIETTGLTKRFPGQPDWRALFRKGTRKVALDTVNLAVQTGETFGVLGPNGAGKTTLVKILCTLITPSDGQAKVAGLDVVSNENAVRQRVGLIYGDARSFYWRLSLFENLKFYASLYRLRGEGANRRIEEMIELVDLKEVANERMHYLSAGMKQRAAIARGLLSDPDIIFLDEPTTSIDPVHAHQIRTMIRERVIEDGSRTVLLSTNVMDEAEMLCDRVALLNYGRIEMQGEVSDLRARFQPDDEYLIRVSEISDTSLDALRLIPGVKEISVQPNGSGMMDLTLRVQRGSSAIPLTIRNLGRTSTDVWSCSKQELTLEQMFRIAFGDSKEQPIREARGDFESSMRLG